MNKKIAVFIGCFLLLNIGCSKPINFQGKAADTRQEVSQTEPAQSTVSKQSETTPDVKAEPPSKSDSKVQQQPQQSKPKTTTQPKSSTNTAPATPKAVVAAPIPPTPTADATSIDIQEVEKMVLDLVNQDRRKNGLSEVVWDETAARAARQHVQEEANIGYISHWGMDGIKPQERYTNAGGKNSVDENESVTLWLQGGFNGISKEDLYKLVAEHESAMLNEQPPEDGHRQNILDKHHTGLGVSISVGKFGVAMAQEFTNHYADLSLTTSGSQAVLTGRIFPGYQASGVYAVWEAAPKPMTKDQLMQTHSYSDPPWDNLHFWAAVDGKHYYVNTSKGQIYGVDLNVDAQGNFSLAIPLASTPGLDYITLEIAPKTNPDDRFYTGQFVIGLK